MALLLPVSLGEAIDKLTILDIKLEQIKDERRIDVLAEYNLLLEKLKGFVEKYSNLYDQMKRVNKLIWDLMTPLRDHHLNNEEYLKFAKNCIELNDIRFRIKSKINTIGASQLKEQKGYHVRTLLIEISKGVDLNLVMPPIKYYSLLYDKIFVVSQELQSCFSNEPNIYIVDKETELEYYDKRLIIDRDKDIYKQFEIEDDKLLKELLSLYS